MLCLCKEKQNLGKRGIYWKGQKSET